MATGFAIAKLTGQDYSWKQAAVDAALGAVGAGIASKLSKLNKLRKAAVAAEGALDELSSAAAQADRGGLTRAGRALAKHAGRPGSAFSSPGGNVQAINEAGQNVVDDILTGPGTKITARSTGRFGNVVEAHAADGRGARWTADLKNFIGFLEP